MKYTKVFHGTTEERAEKILSGLTNKDHEETCWNISSGDGYVYFWDTSKILKHYDTEEEAEQQAIRQCFPKWANSSIFVGEKYKNCRARIPSA